MIAKDLTVYLHERYGMTKEQFCKSMQMSAGETVHYEEESCMHRLPNIDYDKLFVGARIYVDAAELSSLRNAFKEAEVTHLYGGIMFYKFIGEEKEHYTSKDSFHFMRMVYPKIVVKPDFFEMRCDCDKTKFVNYDDCNR